MDNYPDIAGIIIACTQPDSTKRPSAKTVLCLLSTRALPKGAPPASVPSHNSSTAVMGIDKGPKGDLHNDLLRRSIERRDSELELHKRQLAEKQMEIEQLRKEMEELKASHSPGKSSSQLFTSGGK